MKRILSALAVASLWFSLPAQAAILDMTGDMIDVSLIPPSNVFSPDDLGTYTAPNTFAFKDPLTNRILFVELHSTDIEIFNFVYPNLTIDSAPDYNGLTFTFLTGNPGIFLYNESYNNVHIDNVSGVPIPDYHPTSITKNSVNITLNGLVFETPGSSIDVQLITPDSLPPAVPEPATWAMMIIGMGAIGFAMRRQKLTTRVYYVT